MMTVLADISDAAPLIAVAVLGLWALAGVVVFVRWIWGRW